ncbi:MAG: TetR/AcrR family transcriptional regulator [Planctomycetes bacterium]|nr:TetR/AcrR family transcriptional regulator [Planctomycetota bacterium]
MGRPKIIETDDLLRIARETFLEKGVGAPISEIAKRAGISEAAIFKRFPTKSGLFFAALGFPKIDVRGEVEKRSAGKNTIQKLEAILLLFLEYLIESMPILTTLISHPSFNPAEFAEKFPEAPINSLVTELARFLESEKLAGRIGNCDPLVVAGVLFSSIHSFAMFEYMGIHKTDDNSNRTRVQLLVKVLFEGIKPTKNTMA